MTLNLIVPITTKEGFEYLLNFTEFSKDHLPVEIDIPVVDVTIEAKVQMKIYNNAGTLFNISSRISEYLQENNVILYCYCSHEDILKHPKKANLLNQEYRSLLCETMFSRSSNSEIHISEKIIIEDEQGDHYIHLISKIQNSKYFGIISSTVLSFKP